jgi:hypothetical protein
MTCFLPIVYSICLFCSLTLPRSSLSCLASLYCVCVSRGSSVYFLTSMMARIKSTASFVGGTIGSADEGHESEGSVERIEFA